MTLVSIWLEPTYGYPCVNWVFWESNSIWREPRRKFCWIFSSFEDVKYEGNWWQSICPCDLLFCTVKGLQTFCFLVKVLKFYKVSYFSALETNSIFICSFELSRIERKHVQNNSTKNVQREVNRVWQHSRPRHGPGCERGRESRTFVFQTSVPVLNLISHWKKEHIPNKLIV